MFHCLVKYRKSLVGAFWRSNVCMTRENFSTGINDLLKQYLSHSKNVISYLANIDTHVFLERNIMYEIHDQSTSISDWIRSIITRDQTTTVESICEPSKRKPNFGCDSQVSIAKFKDEAEEGDADGNVVVVAENNNNETTNDSTRCGISLLTITTALVLLFKS